MPFATITSVLEQRLIEVASRSTCKRDQRAALLVWAHSGVVIGEGYNGLPLGQPCIDVYCQPTCAGSAEHAEAMALRNGQPSRAVAPAREVDLVHAKVVDGAIVPSRMPCDKACQSCAVSMVAHDVQALWLYHASDAGNYWFRWLSSTYYDAVCGSLLPF